MPEQELRKRVIESANFNCVFGEKYRGSHGNLCLWRECKPQ